MVRTIYKYRIELADTVSVQMPAGAVVLCVQFQSGSGICMWALVDRGVACETRTFRVYGTGHDILTDITAESYVGTVHNAGFVWHFFEVAT